MNVDDDGTGGSERPAGLGEPSSAFAGSGSGWNELAERFGELARDLQEKDDVAGTLNAIVSAAVDTVPGAEYASISTVARRREVSTPAATGELPRAVDRAQYGTGEGPCLDSLYRRRTVRLSDMASETRWPEFADRARALGVRSMLSIQLYVTGDDLGALNLHSTQVDAFDDESEQVGLLFASHAAIALIGAQEQEQLRASVSSRDLIGQAKGVLMERYKIGAHEAFRLLVVASQTTNIKLVDVAGHLASTGQLAGPKSGLSGGA